MATEVLAATHDPLLNSGATLFDAATLLPHSSRVLNATLSGAVYADKFSGRMVKDSVMVQYTSDGGLNWVTWIFVEATSGLEDVGQGLEPIAISTAVPIASIQVRIGTSNFWPDSSCSLRSISLTCTNTPIVAGTYHSFCSAFI